MAKTRFLILFITLLSALGLCAQSLVLKAPGQVVEGRKFTITFTLTDGQASAPQPPQLEGCTFVYGPSTSSMSSVQFINGRQTSTSTISYTYTYRADKAGTAHVPSVSVTCEGKKLSTRAASITILPPDRTAPAQGGSGVDVTDISTQSADRKVNPDDMFVRVSLSKSSAYEQEAVIATVKVYTKYNISSFRILQQPTFEGFLSEELEVPQGVQQEHYNGQNYTTAVLKRCIIFPQKAGKLQIASGKYEVTVVQYELVSNGFFQTRRPVEQKVNTQSNSASLDVRALPAGAPAGFNGAVGSYTAQCTLRPEQLKTNEAATYTIAVSGSGNIKYLKAPELDLPAGIDVYTPKTDIDARFNGTTIAGTYSVAYTLVPQEPGQYEIPAREFAYFNPADGEYHTVSLPAAHMAVTPGAATSAVTEQTAIAKGMDDILHIRPTSASRQSFTHQAAFRSWYYIALYLLAAISFVIVLFVYRRQMRLQADITGRLRARANKQATRRLRQARKEMERGNSDAFHQALGAALWGYMSHKLGIPASGLIRDNISDQLQQYGASPETIASVISILDDCEMARFTPDQSASQMQTLYDQAAAAIKSIEDTPRKQ